MTQEKYSKQKGAKMITRQNIKNEIENRVKDRIVELGLKRFNEPCTDEDIEYVLKETAHLWIIPRLRNTI